MKTEGLRSNGKWLPFASRLHGGGDSFRATLSCSKRCNECEDKRQKEVKIKKGLSGVDSLTGKQLRREKGEECNRGQVELGIEIWKEGMNKRKGEWISERANVGSECKIEEGTEVWSVAKTVQRGVTEQRACCCTPDSLT